MINCGNNRGIIIKFDDDDIKIRLDDYIISDSTKVIPNPEGVEPTENLNTLMINDTTFKLASQSDIDNVKQSLLNLEGTVGQLSETVTSQGSLIGEIQQTVQSLSDNVVYKDLTLLPTAEVNDRTQTLLYVSDGGTPSKISLEQLSNKIIKTVSDDQTIQNGEYIFKEI